MPAKRRPLLVQFYMIMPSLSLSLFSQKKGKGKSRIEKFKEGECRVGRWMQVGDGEKRGKVERRGGVRVDDGS